MTLSVSPSLSSGTLGHGFEPFGAELRGQRGQTEVVTADEGEQIRRARSRSAARRPHGAQPHGLG